LARLERLERRFGVAGAAAPAAEPRVKQLPKVLDATEPIRVVAPVEAETKAPAEPVQTAEPVTQYPAPVGQLDTAQFKDAWAEILNRVNKASKSAWMVAFSLTVVDYTDDILTLKFLSQKDLESFKNASGASDVLRKAIADVFGVQVKFKAQIAAAAAEPEIAAPPVEKNPARADEDARYGESLLREMLGAKPIDKPSGGR
jgi:DNA polymerase-3 subunit gamma/tau